MGLDMYLSKKTYVQRWDHQAPEEKHEVVVTKGGEVLDRIQPERVTYVHEQIGTWRKANSIHKWFVDNVQEGKDDCGEYYVGIDDLMNLLNLCKEVVQNPSRAETLLPTQSGFFFGDIEYDEFYIKDLERTIGILETALSEKYFDKNGREFYSGEYFYSSSW